MPLSPLAPLRAVVKSILEKPFQNHLEWSVQGFGMLRCYFEPDKKFRLNIWDDRLEVPNVSTIHDHPWDFCSWVLNGRFYNRRYHIVEGKPPNYLHMKIKTGPGGGPAGDAVPIHLHGHELEEYLVGDSYRQLADEIHQSIYVNGTVTINDRVRKADGEHANVFWLINQSWVDAEPRPATKEEIAKITRYALLQW